MRESRAPVRKKTRSLALPVVALLAACIAPACIAGTLPRKTPATDQAPSHFRPGDTPPESPVTAAGQITYIDHAWQMMFLRTEKRSLFVSLPGPSEDLHPGDLVRVRGTQGVSPSGPYLKNVQCKRVSAKPLPTPLSVSLAALGGGIDQGQYISTQGVLRPNQSLWGHTHLLLVDGDTSIPIVIPNGPSSAPLRLVGNKVVVRGVAGSQLDAGGRPIGAVLYVQNIHAVRPASPGWQNFLKAPVVSIASLSNFRVHQRFLPAVHLRGAVLWQSGHRFVLKDDSGTILARSLSAPNVKAGDRLDLIGFPAFASNLVELQDARIGTTTHPSVAPAKPHEWSLQHALRSGKDGDRVLLSGTLLDESLKNGLYTFRIADHHRVFQALAAAAHKGGQALTIKPGARIQATGRLRFLHYLDNRPASLQLLVDSPNQIVIEGSRGLNWEEFLFALAAILAIGTAFWILQMRRTLRAKTALLREQVAQEARLEDKYRRLFERSPTAIFIWNPNGQITDCNPAFARMIGFSSPAGLVGASYWSLRTDAQENPAQLATLLQSGPVNDRETSLRRSDGSTVHLLENITRVLTGQGEHYETTALDVTQSRLDRLALQRARLAAQREAEIDALTGLSNRRSFSQIIQDQLQRAAARHTRVALLFLDLDGFKTINDTLGHLIGDTLLQHVSQRLGDQLPAGDLLARLGGDEFAVLLTGNDHPPQPEQIADAMLQSLAAPFRIAGNELTIGASIGISLFPDLATDDTTLLRQADSAMYAAKRSGRNCVVRYNQEIGRALQEKGQITSELKSAIARREIYLHYQPEFDRVQRHIVRFEALARWNSPSLGRVPPIKFIAAAEECGLIHQLGSYLLELACRDAAAWQQKTGQPIPVAVNISFLQLRAEGFVQMVLDILEKTHLPPSSLELEMTESVMLGDFATCRQVLLQLRAAGIKLSLDDFGTGYSSLSYLPELPFDRLKIARSFLEKANRGRGGETLIDAVIGVAHRLGISVVVEGIESLRELEFIQSVGADEIQGFYLGRPGPDPSAVIARHFVSSLTGTRPSVETPTNRLPAPALKVVEI